MNPRILYSTVCQVFYVKDSVPFDLRSGVDRYRTTYKLIKKNPDFAMRAQELIAYALWVHHP